MKKYTVKELEQLKELCDGTRTVRKIASVMGRSEQSLYQKIYKLQCCGFDLRYKGKEKHRPRKYGILEQS